MYQAIHIAAEIDFVSTQDLALIGWHSPEYDNIIFKVHFYFCVLCVDSIRITVIQE